MLWLDPHASGPGTRRKRWRERDGHGVGPPGIVVTTANDPFPESGCDMATVANGGRGPIEPLVASRLAGSTAGR